jgi:hypothetical protein
MSSMKRTNNGSPIPTSHQGPLFIFVKPLLTAEANQRAFLLNGDESYKIAEVYNLAIPI